MNEQSTVAVQKGLRNGGMVTRFVLYFLMFIPIFLTILVLLISSRTRISITGIDAIDDAILILLMASPFIFTEWRIRRWRRAMGLSIYKNVYEDLKQMAVNESVQREVKARESIKVKDIAYYHDLLKSGAITQDEYNKKKEELL